jgi:predicted DsbA family dithiol-disulfide isomerase
MSKKTIKVTIFSDYICPFCYIGFHRIEKLKEKYELDIEWRPFELHPEIPKEGAMVDKLSFPREYLEMAMANVKRLADEDGITLKYSTKLPNSRLALFFSEYARINGKFDQFHKLVFDKYWKEGEDIGDLNLLLDLAESVGLNREELQSYIKSDHPLNELKKSSYELGRYGINGVPTFIIGGRFVIGAQPYEVFENTINGVLEEEALTSESTN